VQIYLWDLNCLHLAVIESNVCRAHHHTTFIAEIHISARACVCARTQSFWRPERVLYVWKSSAVVPHPAFYRLPTAHQKSTDGRLASAIQPSHRPIIIIIISLGGRRYCYHYLVASWRASTERGLPWLLVNLRRPPDPQTQKPHCWMCHRFQFEVSLSRHQMKNQLSKLSGSYLILGFNCAHWHRNHAFEFRDHRWAITYIVI